MKKKLRVMPKLDSEDAERNFWVREDSAEYIDWKSAKRASFPALKPSLKTISIRIPEPMLLRLKTMANKRDVPYQSLIKIILSERIAEEIAGTESRGNT